VSAPYHGHEEELSVCKGRLASLGCRLSGAVHYLGRSWPWDIMLTGNSPLVKTPQQVT